LRNIFHLTVIDQ